jgi:hypothetical protein
VENDWSSLRRVIEFLRVLQNFPSNLGETALDSVRRVLNAGKTGLVSLHIWADRKVSTCWIYGIETSPRNVANLSPMARASERGGKPAEALAASNAIRGIMSWICEKEREGWTGIVIGSEWQR